MREFKIQSEEDVVEFRNIISTNGNFVIQARNPGDNWNSILWIEKETGKLRLGYSTKNVKGLTTVSDECGQIKICII